MQLLRVETREARTSFRIQSLYSWRHEYRHFVLATPAFAVTTL